MTTTTSSLRITLPKRTAKAHADWAYVTDWAYAQKVEGGTEKFALVLLATKAVKIEGEFRNYTTLDELNRRGSMTVAGRCVKKLQGKGLIERRRGPHPDTGRPCNYYVLRVDA